MVYNIHTLYSVAFRFEFCEHLHAGQIFVETVKDNEGR